MFVKRALDREPENGEAREMMGVVLLEIGEVDEARSVSSVLKLQTKIFVDHYD